MHRAFLKSFSKTIEKIGKVTISVLKKIGNNTVNIKDKGKPCIDGMM